MDELCFIGVTGAIAWLLLWAVRPADKPAPGWWPFDSDEGAPQTDKPKATAVRRVPPLPRQRRG